jgi:hypothetical protein
MGMEPASACGYLLYFVHAESQSNAVVVMKGRNKRRSLNFYVELVLNFDFTARAGPDGRWTKNVGSRNSPSARL